MASPARSSASDGLGGDLGPAAIKGGILIFVALALGALLLVRGPDSDLDAATAPADEEQTDDSDTPPATDDETGDTTTTAADATTTTTASEARAPGEVTVLVANGSGLPGVASAATAQLAALGYLTADPDDVKELVTSTTIYYITGFEAEAKAVAEVFGLDPEADGVVAPMPTPLPTQDESLGAANILAVIGPDVTPTDPATSGTTTDTAGTGTDATGTGTDATGTGADATVSGTVLSSE